MKSTALLSTVSLCLAVAVAGPALAQSKAKDATGAGKSRPAAMDMKAMEEMLIKAATPGPNHEKLKHLVGEWNLTVKSMMDPSQPPTVTQSVSVVTSLMDGRYFQETTSGEMMGQPFKGMGVTGYDNIQKKFVSTWIDNMGTGILTSSGTMDAAGKVLTMIGEMADPMSGKLNKYRMVTRFLSADKHTFEMFGEGPDGKEVRMMEITYERRM